MIFDRFAKGAITTSAELAAALSVGYSSTAGVNVSPAVAARFAPVFSCVKVLAESIGALPLHLFKQDGKQRNKATEHPLYELLYLAPNDFQTSQEWREMMTAHLCFRGNHYSWKNIVGGRVRELLPLNPDAVTPKLSDKWEVTYAITAPDGSRHTVPAREIFHVRLMTMDGLVGMNPIEQARNTIGLGIAAEQFGAHLFKNGSRPSGVLTTEKNLTKEQHQALADGWKESNSGGNELRTAILGGGLTWTAISISPDDAQFLETRKYQRSEVAGLYRVPAHMINDMEKATFSNIEHQDLAFVKHSLAPYFTRIEHRIAVSLLSPAERKNHFAKFNVNALLRGDMKARSEYMWRRFQMGSLSANDIREIEDENPIDGGDAYWVPANMMDPEAEPAKTTPMQPAPGSSPGDESESDNPEDDDNA